jgi:hypothetical protein
MSFYKFASEDIIDTEIATYPQYTVVKNGDQVTGSIFLERPFLDTALRERQYTGFSLKEGAIMQKNAPFTASIYFLEAEEGGNNKEMYRTIGNLYDFYNFFNPNYVATYTGSYVGIYRVVSIPEVYFDREILTGSIVLIDHDNAGKQRTLYDDGRGGIYSGSLSGTLVGNVFYSEGIIVLKGGGLNDKVSSNEFGKSSPDNFQWSVSFEGTHKIPVKIFRCHAPAGQLNASTNSTYYQIPTGLNDIHRNQKEIVMDPPATYVTTIGLYNEYFELVGLAKLAQPIKKEIGQDILFRLRIDF